MSIDSDARFDAKLKRMTTDEIERMNPLLLGARKKQLREAELRRRSEGSTERRHGEAVRAVGGPTWLHWAQVIAVAAGVLALVVALFGLIMAP